MLTFEKKSLNQPEEINEPEKFTREIVTIGGLKIKRITAEPGVAVVKTP
jgi:hypothetical protein